VGLKKVDFSEKQKTENNIGITIDIFPAMVVTAMPERRVEYPISKNIKMNESPINSAKGIHLEVRLS
jgi:hypothetical protein